MAVNKIYGWDDVRYLIIFGLCVCFAANALAVDLESNVKDFVKSKDWYSFSIADTFFGSTVGTRAATEDKRIDATLALNYIANNKCVPESVEIIYKTNSVAEEDTKNTIYGNIQLDGSNANRVMASLHEQEGSEFVFIVVDDKYFDEKIKNGNSLFVNFKGFGVAEFSLAGAKKAIEKARSDCKDHVYE
ncbi:hypothetical protein RFH42_03095 [Acinetobacter rudis]|uniref:hypothetical protein n=1 Tax=Acinetobacter rudis TaxID=632955 RepID=UPI00280E6655|nr:hypothetical protein [Acinetobacter rudis]MDQ8951940.1 hypothetical protein [Acinetobacter rudis]